jgi:lipopolysaccharide/colanic/teichoic acid biosynthesis glycosyltransferase
MIDILVSSMGMFIFSPLGVLMLILIKLDSKGPIFFKQERVGKDGYPFQIFKFRTMVEGAVHMGAGYLIEKDDFRITRVGKFLRRTSLDELPQLINILRGEMSLVGPRPTLRYQVEQYDDWQKRRLLVKPGVTGWAQIHGRNELSWNERIEYDIWYLEHWSVSLDLKILMKTLWIVLKRKGLYGDGEKFDIRPSSRSRS